MKMPAVLWFCEHPRTSQLVIFRKLLGSVTMAGYLHFSFLGIEHRDKVQSLKRTPPLTIINKQSISC